MEEYKFAVVMTCYNRKNMTIKCIETLSKGKQKYNIDLFICDDGSTDGTADEIRKRFPFANVIVGSGNLFWCKGMHAAMEKAVERGYDFYVMVNDDVDFFEDVFDTLLDTYIMSGVCCGVVGHTISKVDGKVTYGGLQGDYVKMFGKNIGIRNEHIVTSLDNELARCLLANWNCFMIDKKTMDIIGMIDSSYEHGVGDYDYTLMMNEKGIPVFATKKPVGYCERNPIDNTFRDNKLSRVERIMKLLSRKGFPVKSRCYYQKKHWGRLGMVYVVRFYSYYIRKILMGKMC